MKVSTVLRALVLNFLMQMCSFPAMALVSPRDGSRFTQVHIMFECDDIYGADTYEITIYRLVSNKDSVFAEQVVNVKTAWLAYLVDKGLDFGNGYRWQFRAYKKQKLIFTSSFNQFTILQSAQVMKDSFRTEISFTGQPGKEIIFLDYSAMAIDKKGNPVWFLPVNTDSLSKWVVRDLQLTPYGTATYLDIHGAYEKELNGTLLWKAPDDGRVSGSAREEYHHELKKNNDGSYMVCGSIYHSTQGNIKPSAPSSVRYNTLICYNTKGGILWSWNELNSMQQDSLFSQAHGNGQGGHLNGFALTPDGKKVFMSFKNMSDVYLLDIFSGRFITSLKQSCLSASVNLQQQHGPYITAKKQLLIYNNNIAEKEEQEGDAASHPSVLLFRYDTALQQCSLAWQYEVHAVKYPQGIQGKEGYASETKAGNVLICTGGANYAAEVTPGKKKVWECYFYHRTKADTAWKPYSNYRCQVASSLYPLYCTIQYAGRKNSQYIFRLCNAGSEPANYELFFTGTAAKTVLRQSSKKLAPGESQLVTVSGPYNGLNELTCRVIPRNVSGPYKEYHYSKLP